MLSIQLPSLCKLLHQLGAQTGQFAPRPATPARHAVNPLLLSVEHTARDARQHEQRHLEHVVEERLQPPRVHHGALPLCSALFCCLSLSLSCARRHRHACPLLSSCVPAPGLTRAAASYHSNTMRARAPSGRGWRSPRAVRSPPGRTSSAHCRQRRRDGTSCYPPSRSTRRRLAARRRSSAPRPRAPSPQKRQRSGGARP